MQKIEKNIMLATEYKKWLDKINKKAKHPIYTSSNHRFYYDVIANLLWVQKGLCAYTELFLCNAKYFDKLNWDNGKFNQFEFKGQLDHYDATLKEKKGWDWNNFFMIDSDVNRKKNNKKMSGYLKPDKDDYDPFYFLEYDFKTHNFIPSTERTDEAQDKILEEINILGLNFQPIIDNRKNYITPLIDDVSLGIKSQNDVRKNLFQFYTSFEMSLRGLQLQSPTN
ncbi:MAG: hypothetical protein QM541_16300 [Flavobacterium sp.]|nr:hypothetical protein [Flavobacterium sp.]